MARHSWLTGTQVRGPANFVVVTLLLLRDQLCSLKNNLCILFFVFVLSENEFNIYYILGI